MMQAFLIAVMLCSLNCRSYIPVASEQTPPPLPSPPIQKPVRFTTDERGLLLSSEQYRNLEFNIIELRRYIKELEAQLYFFRGGIHESPGTK